MDDDSAVVFFSFTRVNGWKLNRCASSTMKVFSVIDCKQRIENGTMMSLTFGRCLVAVSSYHTCNRREDAIQMSDNQGDNQAIRHHR